jgi:predicted nucleic acid-binding protein
MIVVDANIIIYLVRECAFTPMARKVYAMDPCWMVPELWEAEVLNGFMREVRAGHLDLEHAIRASSNAATLLAGKVRKCDRAAVLRIADNSGLTAYDAYYVALARSLGVVVITEDGRILRNCPDVARSLKTFLGIEEFPTVVREKRAAYRARRKRQSS